MYTTERGCRGLFRGILLHLLAKSLSCLFCMFIRLLIGNYFSLQRARKITAASKKTRGSFQKFYTLYAFSSKMNLFYKIHLQAFNVISIVFYHSGPTFGKVLHSCQDAFLVAASDYSSHLIRHLLSASEAFPTEWFLQFWEQVKGWWAHVRAVQREGKYLLSILFQNFQYYT